MKIVCFMKYPRKGKVKTRLAKTIGDSAALSLYQEMLKEVTSVLGSLSDDFSTELCYAGASEGEMTESYEDFDVSEQIEGGLGEKLQARVDKHFNENEEAICFIGSDCIDIDADLFAQTQELFSLGKDLVIGPSDDGGYYLIALRQNYQYIFEDIDWSTEKVFQQTIDKAIDHDLELAVLDQRTDLDTFEVLPERWKEKFKEFING